jgi:hypothetical protein
VRGGAGGGYDHLDAALRSGRDELVEKGGGAVCRQNLHHVLDAEFLERVEASLHDLEIALASDDDRDGFFLAHFHFS